MIVVWTILAFFGAMLIGFILIKLAHIFIMRSWMYERVFNGTLHYIETHGRGFNEVENLAAIASNQGVRLRFVLHVILGPFALLAIIIVALGCNGMIALPVAIAIIIGYLIAGVVFGWIHLCIEMASQAVCGQLTKTEKDKNQLTIQLPSGDELTFDYTGYIVPDKVLVCGKKFLVGNYLYRFAIAPCDYYEWNDQKFPDAS